MNTNLHSALALAALIAIGTYTGASAGAAD